LLGSDECNLARKAGSGNWNVLWHKSVNVAIKMQDAYIERWSRMQSEFNFCNLRMPGICVAILSVPSVALQKFCLEGEIFF
jgi:hypothetical protein